MFFLLVGACTGVVQNYLSSWALWGMGGKTELRAFSAANNHKIHLEKPCKVATEIRWPQIGFGLLRKK